MKLPVALIVAQIIFSGCTMNSNETVDAKQEAPSYDNENFLKAIMGKNRRTQQSVRDLLGEPAAIEFHGEMEIWYYKVSVTGLNGKLTNPAIHFVGDKANLIQYHSPKKIDEKIAMANLHDKTAASAKTGKKKFTSAEIRSLTKYRTQEEVLEALGEPDGKFMRNGKEVWKYNDLVESKGERWDQNLQFKRGRMVYDWIG